MTRGSQAGPTRRVVMIGFPGAQILDITGPLEIFKGASDVVARRALATHAAYELVLATADGTPFATSCGVRLMPDCGLDSLQFPIDTLLVSGGTGTQNAMRDRRLIGFLRDRSADIRRIASVCSGAFLLAQAGLLAGRRSASHWNSCDLLATSFPDVTVDRDALYVKDGKFYGSAGVTAGMDLSLSLIAEDWGRAVALDVAKDKVLFMMRGGGQSQFSSQLLAQTAETPKMQRLLEWVCDNLAADLSVNGLADQVAMSPRNFIRTFARETGATPGRFVECARIDAARRRLEESPDSLERIAALCGFGSAERMRRAFQRQLGVSPNSYRERFAATERCDLTRERSKHDG